MEREPGLPLAGSWGETASTGNPELAQVHAGAGCRPPPWACPAPVAVAPPASTQAFSSGPRVFHSPVLTPRQTWSLVNLFHLPDDLLFKDGQDGVILPHLLEDHTTVELVTHLLKVIPEKPETWGQRGKKAGEWS